MLFAKISSEIIAATRAAGGDVSNIRVQAAITKAKVSTAAREGLETVLMLSHLLCWYAEQANNMSKSTIDNALKRGVEAKAGATLEVSRR